MDPPDELDGARVVCWAYSQEPFFVMADGGAGMTIHGLAVCQYPNGTVYRFSCDKDWEVQNDTDFESVEIALHAQSGQYDIEEIRWISRKI